LISRKDTVLPGFEVIGKEEKKAINRLFDEGKVFFAHGFDKKRKYFHVREFEKNLKTIFVDKMSDALCVSSGTAAIKVALKALDIGPGDEVITQAFNFIATVEAIFDTGAKIVLTDIDETLNMCPNSLQELITKRTKAIIPVHMLGVPADMVAINKISRKSSIPVVEDACEAIGAKVQGCFVGGLGDFGIFSFDFGKMITTGEGGAIFSKSKTMAKIVRMYHDHGHKNMVGVPRGQDTAGIVGFNYRMTEISGTFGKEQLKKFPNILEKSKKRFKILEENISSLFTQNRLISHGNEPNYDTFVLIVENKIIRKKIIEVLNQMEFGTKNLPDAFNWHCAYFWKHVDNNIRTKEVENTYKKLLKCVAIPIMVSRSLRDYKNLAKEINVCKK
jgi:8-amino-3,8-dideoxy-alpha-D-manno-octulosonate transaminase